jgi:hypothetical protein
MAKKTNQISKDVLKQSKSLLVQDPRTLDIEKTIFPNNIQVGLDDERFNSTTTLHGRLFVSSSVFVENNVTISGTLYGGSPLKLGNSIILPENKFINFGTIEEELGYGFRDNSGALEVKDSGGSWAPATPVALLPRTITATGDMLVTDTVLLLNASSSPVHLTLVTASLYASKSLYIKRLDSTVQSVVVSASAGETIDGAAAKTLSSQWDAITLINDSSSWFIF